MDRELTPKQQTSEAIRQAESVLIISGQHPTIDQVAATIALGSVLRKFGKKVSTVISDDIPAGAKFLSTSNLERKLGGLRDFILEVGLNHAEVDTIRYTIENGKLNVHISPFAGAFKPEDVGYSYGDYQYDLVIVLGVASYARIDKVYSQNAQLLRQIPLVNIDFHRSNEQYGAINLIEPNAASLGEILVALSESLQTGLIDTEIATTILAGIMAATDRFTATHTTSKALTVAAQMMAMGADQQQVVRGLYRGKSQPKTEKLAERKREEQPAPNQPKSEAIKPAPAAAVTETRQVEPASRPNPQPEPVESAPAPAQVPAQQLPAQPQGTLRLDSSQNRPAMPDVVAPLDGQEEPLTLNAQPELEMDGPVVTDPDNEATPLMDVEQNYEPEPLINGNDPAPQPKVQAEAKASNPTNNPVFANRLS